MKNPIQSSPILLAAVLASLVVCSAWAAPALPVQESVPLAALLKPDGALNLAEGFAGSVDVKGYRMVTGTNGEPRFVSDNQAPSSMQEATAAGPESSSDDVYWDDQFHYPGALGVVRTVATDGAGNIYIGGNFSAVGNAVANNIAKWNGTSWSALGSGVSYSENYNNRSGVHAIAVDGSDIYVGGHFTSAGGVSVNNIAKWNGTAWSALGTGVIGNTSACSDIDARVTALAVNVGVLYAGGFFTAAGGVPVSSIAKWDGASWSAMGSGVSFPEWYSYPGYVTALAADGSSMYVGGSFSSAGGTAAANIARWDGASWSAIGSGTNGYVAALALDGGNVYVGGNFTVAGGVSVGYTAKWDGASWSALGTGVSGPVYALATSGSDVYAGGAFTSAGGAGASNIARWDGASWSALGTGMGSAVSAIVVNGNGLYASASGASTANIARWDGASWSVLGSGFDNCTWVRALAVDGHNVYVGGRFMIVDGVIVNNIARWDGASWSALGGGVGGTVNVLALSGSDLYAGGEFWKADGLDVNGIAKWNGSSWSALGSGVTFGSHNGFVHALAVSGTDLYVGGAFEAAGGARAVGIAKWDGSTWSALGPEMYGWDYWDEEEGWCHAGPVVYALAMNGSSLYAGGSFLMDGGIEYVAKWDGTFWSAVGSGFVSDSIPEAYLIAVNAMAVSGNDLYAGGNFTTAGGVPARHIAKWDGTSWSALGSGFPAYVQCITVSDSGVCAACTGRIAMWNGTDWSAVGSPLTDPSNYGLSAPVLALATSGNVLFAGGKFMNIGATVSAYMGVWQPRVNVTNEVVSATPGVMTIGNDIYGFYKPALMTGSGTSVSYGGGLPATVTLDRADEIHLGGKRINGAFTLSPEGMQFGGDGAVLRVEFSEDDCALFGRPYTDFRAAKLTYPSNYPASKEAASVTVLDAAVPVPIRIENGRQIYAISVAVTGIASTYGAVVPVVSGSDLSGEWVSTTVTSRGVCTIRGRYAATNTGSNQRNVSATVYVCDQPTLAASTEVHQFVKRLGTLRGGSTRQIPIVLRLPRGVTASGRYLITQIDSGNVVTEVDENNNWSVTGPLP